MFGIDSVELLLIVVVAVVVIGPKDLPRALYKVGQVVGKGRAMARHFRTGLDAMIREAELADLQKQWDKENARIMAEHPVQQSVMTEKPLVDGAQEEAAPDSAAEAEPLLSPDERIAAAVNETPASPPEAPGPAESVVTEPDTPEPARDEPAAEPKGSAAQ